MKRKLSKKVKIIICSVAAVLIAVGIIAYIAADRFLIEHVEFDLNSTASASESVLPSTSSGVSSSSAPISSAGNGASSDNASDNAETNSATPEYTATDMSYTSDSRTITITKVVTGSGKNQLVYFVADVQLTDGTELQSAFAKNQFGTNIIEVPSVIAKRNDAIFAINGDYYGFRSDGVVIRNGVIYRNSPAREGLAIYEDGSMEVYDETATTADQLLADGVWNTLSFGPTLLKDGAIVSGIDNVEIDTNFGNHSVQGYQPRTGIGIIDDNHFIFVVADGRNAGYSTGVTMSGFAQIFKDLGCTTAYNLDGGGSSEMYFMGNVINVPCNKNGNERGTSDILYIS